MNPQTMPNNILVLLEITNIHTNLLLNVHTRMSPKRNYRRVFKLIHDYFEFTLYSSENCSICYIKTFIFFLKVELSVLDFFRSFGYSLEIVFGLLNTNDIIRRIISIFDSYLWLVIDVDLSWNKNVNNIIKDPVE